MKHCKYTAPLVLKQGTLETVDSYSSASIHVYTDGSAFKATINIGAGILLKYLDGTKSNIQHHVESMLQLCRNIKKKVITAEWLVENLESK